MRNEEYLTTEYTEFTEEEGEYRIEAPCPLCPPWFYSLFS
jgi:hypothetical protein